MTTPKNKKTEKDQGTAHKILELLRLNQTKNLLIKWRRIEGQTHYPEIPCVSRSRRFIVCKKNE